MGSWSIEKNKEQKRLIHTNIKSGVVTFCGTVGSHIDDGQIVKWIVDKGGPKVGDIIKLSTGQSFAYSKPTQEVN